MSGGIEMAHECLTADERIEQAAEKVKALITVFRSTGNKFELPTGWQAPSGVWYIDGWENQCGIYFLTRDKDVVYVGQSTALWSRITAHRTVGPTFGDWSRVMVIPCPQGGLSVLERYFIAALVPKHNTQVYSRPSADEAILHLNGLLPAWWDQTGHKGG